mmetsp:Transcript_39137/g.122423  ORF Transcript_39137/g.122423 Transcript_39137/m.122423 type:complete len:332 (+) Transcript_39137:63-1058(+)
MRLTIARGSEALPGRRHVPTAPRLHRGVRRRGESRAAARRPCRAPPHRGSGQPGALRRQRLRARAAAARDAAPRPRRHDRERGVPQAPGPLRRPRRRAVAPLRARRPRRGEPLLQAGPPDHLHRGSAAQLDDGALRGPRLHGSTAARGRAGRRRRHARRPGGDLPRRWRPRRRDHLPHPPRGPGLHFPAQRAAALQRRAHPGGFAPPPRRPQGRAPLRRALPLLERREQRARGARGRAAAARARGLGPLLPEHAPQLRGARGPVRAARGGLRGGGGLRARGEHVLRAAAAAGLPRPRRRRRQPPRRRPVVQEEDAVLRRRGLPLRAALPRA